MCCTAVRAAGPSDVDAIAWIYNQGIGDRLATLETETRTADERRRWLLGRGPRHPVIVAEVDGRVVGWGSLNAFNPRSAYDHVADFPSTWSAVGAGGASDGGSWRRSSRAAASSATTSSCSPPFPSITPAWRSTSASGSATSACTTSKAYWMGDGSTSW